MKSIIAEVNLQKYAQAQIIPSFYGAVNKVVFDGQPPWHPIPLALWYSMLFFEMRVSTQLCIAPNLAQLPKLVVVQLSVGVRGLGRDQDAMIRPNLFNASFH